MTDDDLRPVGSVAPLSEDERSVLQFIRGYPALESLLTALDLAPERTIGIGTRWAQTCHVVSVVGLAIIAERQACAQIASEAARLVDCSPAARYTAARIADVIARRGERGDLWSDPS